MSVALKETIVLNCCLPQQVSDWIEFLDQTFGYQKPNSYGVDFAPLFEKDVLSNSRLLFMNSQIISSATLYVVRVCLGHNSYLKLGIIGAVATSKQHQRHGHSTYLLNELEQCALTLNIDALVLWSDRAAFYQDQGFFSVGSQAIYSLEQIQAPQVFPKGSPEYGWNWTHVRQLYEQHPLRIARTDDHWKALEKIQSCSLLQWKSENGEILAYIGFDRGKDLNNVIHEWGGNSNAIHSLVWIALQNRPNLLWLTHPKLDDPIRKKMPIAKPVHTGSLAFLKPLKDLDPGVFENIWFWGLDSL